MSTTSEELKKLYKKLGGDEENIRKASTPAEILNGINELDLTIPGGIEDLNDVDISDPKAGDAIRYNGEKWVNGQGSSDVSKTATGNPIEISDGANAPLVKCVSAITGSQDLHGYDKPWVGGAGKNKFGGEFGTSYKYPIPSGATQMTFSAKSNGSYKLSVRTYDSNGTKIGSDYAVVDVGNTTGYVSLTLPNDAVTFMLFISGGGSATDFSEVQAEVGSTATTYAPYSNICPITAYTEGEIEVSDGDGNTTTHATTYPSAIYRGSEDVVKGEVTEELVVVDLGSLEWSLGATFYAPLPLSKIGPLSTIRGICSHYAWSTITSATGNIDDKSFVLGNTYAYVYIKDTSYSDATTFKAAMSGVTLAYELATPTTSSVTPTNLPIKSLLGYNHIESSTGEMEIEYITSKYQPIVDLISESSGGDSGYSETTLWENASGTHGQIALSDNLSNYDAICVIMAPNNEPTYRSSQIIPVSAIDTTGATHFGIFVSGATSYCSSMTYVDDTHISCDSWASNYPMLYFKVVGILS